MIIVRYDAKGAPKCFWHRLYGYSKGKYVYPGVLDRLESARRLSDSTVLIGDADLAVLENFLKTWRIPYEKYAVERPGVRETKRPVPEPLRWDMPLEVLDERLRELGGKMDGLGPFIRTKSVRNALEDVLRYGY